SQGGGELRERIGGDRPICSNRLHRFLRSIVSDAFMAASDQPAHHVGAHAPEPHHSDSHTHLQPEAVEFTRPLANLAVRFVLRIVRKQMTERPRAVPWAAGSTACNAWPRKAPSGDFTPRIHALRPYGPALPGVQNCSGQFCAPISQYQFGVRLI